MVRRQHIPTLKTVMYEFLGEKGWTEFYCRGFGTYWIKRDTDGYLMVLTGSKKQPCSSPVREAVARKVEGIF